VESNFIMFTKLGEKLLHKSSKEKHWVFHTTMKVQQNGRKDVAREIGKGENGNVSFRNLY
jgi:hypothetical protein